MKLCSYSFTIAFITDNNYFKYCYAEFGVISNTPSTQSSGYLILSLMSTILSDSKNPTNGPYNCCAQSVHPMAFLHTASEETRKTFISRFPGQGYRPE